MQLLLILAVLASPVCRAQEIYGPGGGSYFFIKNGEDREIRAIRVFIGSLGFIKALQLRFGDLWSPRFGAPGGAAYEFALRQGEHVTAVRGRAGLCLRQLVWVTSAGRTAVFGSATGGGFSARAPGPGLQLRTVNGQASVLCLTGIGFTWGPAPADSASESSQESSEESSEESSQETSEETSEESSEESSEDSSEESPEQPTKKPRKPTIKPTPTLDPGITEVLEVEAFF